ncbi:diguanylate cyclase [Nitratifractor sp.]|uniref:diguanylate cyclase domain-containing protein n=1 Tax=Nitratifractor sp. TaxID=2268144 RepID=UPI0025DC1C3E|nr:diguanylate cyclase [Nitratifractor sp.]
MPIGMYIVYHQMGNFVSCEKVVRDTARSGGDMLEMALTPDSQRQKILIQRIDRTLKDDRSWFVQNDGSPYYVGNSTPLKDYESLLQCWKDLKQSPSREKALQCWTEARSLTFAVERLNTLTFTSIRNKMFLTMILSVILLLLLVYVVRYYMYHQVCKGIVHSPEEGLHDREYCRLSLTQLCAQAERSERPLSTTRIDVKKIPGHRVEVYAKILTKLGDVLKETTRLSDVVCRIQDDTFFILMPNTDQEGAEMAVKRIHTLLNKRFEKEKDKIEIEVGSFTLKEGEKCNDFWKRSIKRHA